MQNKKDYINNIYQPYSNDVSPIQTNNYVGNYSNQIENFDQPHSNYVAPIQYNQRLGVFYNERPNWMGGQTEDLDQRINEYTFQPVNFRR